MKTRKLKSFFVTSFILTILISFTACSNGSIMEVANPPKIDVVLWNTYGDNFPSASGVDLVQYAANQFENKTGIAVNLISIEANTQEQPEMLLFNTHNQDELQVIESMKNELLQISDFIDNSDDVFDGMHGDHYSAFAILVYGNVLNNALLDEYGIDNGIAFMSAKDVENLYMRWAETDSAELNVFDYLKFSELGLTSMLQIEEEKISLDHDQIIMKIMRNESFVQNFPERKLSKDDVIDIYTGKNKVLYDKERDALLSMAHLRPVNFLTKEAFNAIDLIDFSRRNSTDESGFVMSDYSLSTFVGFGILDNQSKEQEHAIAFANYLLSPEFQMEMQSYTTKTPKMSGTVLKSVAVNNADLARSKELLDDGKPIRESVIEAYDIMTEHFNQPGAMHFSSVSSISRVAFDEIIRLSTEYIWGDFKSEDELRADLIKLEDRLNLMINE